MKSLEGQSVMERNLWEFFKRFEEGERERRRRETYEQFANYGNRRFAFLFACHFVIGSCALFYSDLHGTVTHSFLFFETQLANNCCIPILPSNE